MTRSGPKRKPSILRHRAYMFARVTKGGRIRAVEKSYRAALDTLGPGEYVSKVMVSTQHALGPDFDIDPFPIREDRSDAGEDHD